MYKVKLAPILAQNMCKSTTFLQNMILAQRFNKTPQKHARLWKMMQTGISQQRSNPVLVPSFAEKTAPKLSRAEMLSAPWKCYIRVILYMAAAVTSHRSFPNAPFPTVLI